MVVCDSIVVAVDVTVVTEYVVTVVVAKSRINWIIFVLIWSEQQTLYFRSVELYNINDLPSHSGRLHEKFLCVSVSFRSAHFWIVPSVQFLFCMTIPWPQVSSIPVASHWVTLSHPEIIRSQSLRGLPASLHDNIRVKWPPWSFQLLSSSHSASSHLFSVPSVQLRICMMRPGPHPLCSSVGTHVSLLVQFPSRLGMGAIMNRNAIAENDYC